MNIHFHQLFVDGCFELSDKNEPIDFWVATPPTVKEIEEVLTKIIQKITKYLERQKIIIRDDNNGGFQIPIPDEDTLSKLQATSVTYRFATGKSTRVIGRGYFRSAKDCELSLAGSKNYLLLIMILEINFPSNLSKTRTIRTVRSLH